jgi:hypothetical protein
VASGASFAIGDAVRPGGLRVCIGGPSAEAMERALGILARLARDRPEPALLAV